MAKFIDGRSIASSVRQKLPARIARLPRKPGLGVVLAGNDPASELYIKLKKRAAGTAGILFALERFDADAGTGTIMECIAAWNVDPRIDAILVQLPLPSGVDEQAVIQRIDPEKDVDGFHPVNTGRYLSDERSDPPALIEGIMRLIASTGVGLQGLRATIVARESVFTRCLGHALSSAGAVPVTTPPDGTHHNATVGADVVITAAGRPALITGGDCKPGGIVIDVGINALPSGTVVGDVETKTVTPIAGWLTPVPGGVGPMTIAMLLENVVRLAERNQA